MENYSFFKRCQLRNIFIWEKGRKIKNDRKGRKEQQREGGWSGRWNTDFLPDCSFPGGLQHLGLPAPDWMRAWISVWVFHRVARSYVLEPLFAACPACTNKQDWIPGILTLDASIPSTLPLLCYRAHPQQLVSKGQKKPSGCCAIHEKVHSHYTTVYWIHTRTCEKSQWKNT